MRKIKDPVVLELKKVMNERELSAAVMARLIGCSQSQVGRWIKGTNKPTQVYRMLIRRGLKRINSL